LVESYALADDRLVHHLDLYRLADPDELEWIGIRDLVTDQAICLIEWPERGTGMLPSADWVINLSVEGCGRKATLSKALVSPEE
jgi:tRNA threonylcarbamoyladenosine biosynthesis protein TsaE